MYSTIFTTSVNITGKNKKGWEKESLCTQRQGYCCFMSCPIINALKINSRCR